MDTSESSDGSLVQIWDCKDRVPHNDWFYVIDDETIRFVAPDGTHKCLDLYNHNTDNGADLVIWECNGNPQQKWALGDGTGASLVYHNRAAEIAYITSIVLLSVALCGSLCCNGFQCRKARKNMEESS